MCAKKDFPNSGKSVFFLVVGSFLGATLFFKKLRPLTV